MTNSHSSRTSSVFVCAALLVIACVPFYSNARNVATSTSVNITNQSSRPILHVYVSHVGADDWGVNQLGDSTIATGQSFDLTINSWDQQQLKVIAEDQDGCFMSTVVTSGDSGHWTINNDTTRDCG